MIFSRLRRSRLGPAGNILQCADHFPDDLLAALQSKAVGRLSVTLHVRAGTFTPVRGQHLDDHVMHAEWLELPAARIKPLVATLFDLYERFVEGEAPREEAGSLRVPGESEGAFQPPPDLPRCAGAEEKDEWTGLGG